MKKLFNKSFIPANQHIRYKSRILFCFMCLGLTLSANNTFIREVNGVVRVLSGINSIPATNNMQLPAGSIIKTFNNSSAVLVLPDGTERKIGPGTVVSLNSLNNTGTKGNLETLFLKLRNDKTGIVTPGTVAGVRGSEQGKKAGFGVKWQGAGSEQNSSILYDRAVKAYGNGEYEKAKEGFTGYLSGTAAADLEVKAQYFRLLSEIELLDYSGALVSITALEKKETGIEISSTLDYHRAFCQFMTGDAAAEKNLEIFFKKNPKHNLHWNAKVLELLIAVNAKDTAKARRIRDDISVNCKDTEIHASVMACDI